MKVALCSDFFYPKIGGISAHMEQLAIALQKRGHEVIVVTKKDDYKDNFPFKVIRINTVLKSSLAIDIPKVDELKKVIKKEKPDVIHAHHAFSPLSLLSIKIGKDFGIKTVLTNHSIQPLYYFDYVWKPSSYVLFPFKFYLPYADKIIAVSKAAKEFISKFVNKEVEVIPNGIFVEEFRVRKKDYSKKEVLFTGRLVFRKGILNLMKAFKIVKNEEKNVKLKIVGDGYLLPIIKILRMFFDGHVKVLGKVNREKLIAEYKNSSVFVLPSIFGESFGIVLLEAMASKNAIVASYHGGIKEIIEHKKTGLLFNRWKTKKLAENIIYLLQNEKECKRLAENAFREVKKYDWKRIVKKIEEVYR